MARRVRREPAAVDRPGLDGAELQHPQPPSEDVEGQHPISRLARPVAPADPLSGIASQYPAGQRTAPASRSRVKGSGMRASMAGPNGASGARSTSVARQANGTFAERGDRRANTGNPGGRSHHQRRRRCSHAAGTSGPDPARSADRQRHRPLSWFACKPGEGPPEGLPRSFRPARTPNHGSPTPPEQPPATKPCAHHAASVGRFGVDGAAITAEAASK